MKKFSGLCLSFMLLVLFFFSGCTNADNAKLINISDKYDSIGSNNKEIFCSSTISSNNREVTTWLMNPTYNSNDLNYLINCTNDENYTVLKTTSSISQDTIFSDFGAYGILMQGVNVTFVTSKNIFQVIENNEIVEKQYKKNMYIALEDLQENVKKLTNYKKSLENSFNDSSKDNIQNDEIVLYNLGKYKTALNNCLNNMLTLNRNLLSADENNLTEKVDIDALWDNYLFKVSYSNNKQLVCATANLISQYVLSYSINLKDNINENKTLLTNLANLIGYLYNLPSESLSDYNKYVDNYKVLISQLDALKKSETSFNNAIDELTKEKIENQSEEDKINLEAVDNYSKKLENYSNRLLSYLKTVCEN